MKILKKIMIIVALIFPAMIFCFGVNAYALNEDTDSMLIVATKSTATPTGSPIKKGINDAKATTGMKAEGEADVNNVVQTIITILIWLVGVLAVIMIIYGGIIYTTSGGDPGKVKKGKDTIIYGIVGLIIAILAFVIVNFVINVVTPT